MGEYSKKLHIRKSVSVQDINLYTATSDIVSGQYIQLRDGSTLLYAALGNTTDSLASSLRIRKGGTVYGVLKKSYYPTGSTTYNVKDAMKSRKEYTLSLPAYTKKISVHCSYTDKTNYYNVSDVSSVHIVMYCTQEYRHTENHFYLYKGTDSSGTLLYNLDEMNIFNVTISWSPAINNS